MVGAMHAGDFVGQRDQSRERLAEIGVMGCFDVVDQPIEASSHPASASTFGVAASVAIVSSASISASLIAAPSVRWPPQQ